MVDNSDGLHPDFSSALSRMFAAAPGNGLTVDSGYRTPEQQQSLFNQAVAKYGSEDAARHWVAPPGQSFHNQGMAADLSGPALAWAHDNAANYGLTFPMAHEPWHIELAGVRSPVATALRGGVGSNMLNLDVNPRTTDVVPPTQVTPGINPRPQGNGVPGFSQGVYTFPGSGSSFDIGSFLQNAGAGMVGLGNPELAKAMYAAQAKQQVAPDWQHVMSQDGKHVIQIEKNTGAVRAIPVPEEGDKKFKDAYDETSGKDFAALPGKIASNADDARNMLDNINSLRTFLGNPNVYQGTGGEQAAMLKKLPVIGDWFGEGASDTDAAKAIMNKLALQIRSPAGGAGMPGSLSDTDREFLKSSTLNLENTRAGNAKIADLAAKTAQRSIDVEGLAQNYAQMHGRLDQGFYRELRQWSNDPKNSIKASVSGSNTAGFKILSVEGK